MSHYEYPEDWTNKVTELLPNTTYDNPQDVGYWYLAGPMTGLPGYNYPAFHEAAKTLRAHGFTIVSPAEFEHEQERKEIEESNGSAAGPVWEEALARDVVIVAHPNCKGVVCIDGWENSRGARLETTVAKSLGKPVFKLSTGPFALRGFDPLEQIAKDEAKKRSEEQLQKSLLDALKEDVKRHTGQPWRISPGIQPSPIPYYPGRPIIWCGESDGTAPIKTTTGGV